MNDQALPTESADLLDLLLRADGGTWPRSGSATRQ